MELDAVVQEKLDNDTEFQESLSAMSDEDKATAINEKRAEITRVEFKSLGDKAKKDEEIAKDQKTRAEKAEGELKKLKPTENTETKPTELSQKDVLALAKADVHEDDMDDVIEFAAFKKIPVSEALKNSTLKTILAEKIEFRKTADAANTGAQRRVTTKVTEETLIKDLSEGKIPEPGSEDAEKLFWARRKKKQ